MTVLRYIFGTLWCGFVWLMVAVIIGFVMIVIFPVNHGADSVMVGIGLNWHNLPGTILGLLAARQSWRIHVMRPAVKPPPLPSDTSCT